MARRGLLLAVVVWTWPRWAAAQTLEWSAPRGCSSRGEVIELVRATLGRDAPSRRPLDVHVAIQPGMHGHLIVDLTAEEGEGSTTGRHFEAESCDAAAAATAVIVALLVDPRRAPAGPPVTPAPPAAPPPVPPAPPMPAPPVSLALSAASAPPDALVPSRAPLVAGVALEREPRATGASTGSGALAVLHLLSARVSIGGDLGTVSHANVGGELAVAASIRAWRVELFGSPWANSTATASGDASEGVHVALFTLGGRTGYRFERGAFAVTPVVGVEADHASATGFGGSVRASPSATWAGIDFGGVGTWWMTRWLGLDVAVEGLVPLTRPTFVATNPAPSGNFFIEQPSVVVGRAFFGVECRFF